MQFANDNGFDLLCSQRIAYEMVLEFAASEKGEAEESILAEFV